MPRSLPIIHFRILLQVHLLFIYYNVWTYVPIYFSHVKRNPISGYIGRVWHSQHDCRHPMVVPPFPGGRRPHVASAHLLNARLVGACTRSRSTPNGSIDLGQSSYEIWRSNHGRSRHQKMVWCGLIQGEASYKENHPFPISIKFQHPIGGELGASSRKPLDPPLCRKYGGYRKHPKDMEIYYCITLSWYV